MDGYCLVGNMDKALRVFNDMVSAGIEPNEVLYGVLVNGYCKIGRINDGLSVFREMCRRESSPQLLCMTLYCMGSFRSGEQFLQRKDLIK
jgi:pentatricopeptide repeat protein